jgi:hypothetical protein
MTNPPTPEDVLWDLEKRFWLDGTDIYEEAMAEDGLMLFPAPAGLMDRAAAIGGLAGAPRWRDVAMSTRTLRRLGPGGVLLAYQAEARRDGDNQPYRALCASTYRDEAGAWRLVSHQQTPL